jgi:hypothetical protein
MSSEEDDVEVLSEVSSILCLQVDDAGSLEAEFYGRISVGAKL